MVNEMVLSAARAMRVAPHAVQATTPAVTCTGRLWEASAAPHAGGATTASATHVTRVHHTRMLLRFTHSAWRVRTLGDDSCGRLVWCYDSVLEVDVGVKVDLPAGTSTGVGSLPSRDVSSAVRSALEATTLPFVPSLPRRSPAEGMIAQAVVGMKGVTLGQYGSIAVDVPELDPEAPFVTDLHHDAFLSMRVAVEEAKRRALTGALKWQITGPVTLGLALERAGAPVEVAFDVALRAVQQRATFLLDHISRSLPGISQVVFLDEPGMAALHQPHFPLAPDDAIDVMSAALAVVEPHALTGVHCCGPVDVVSLLAAGPEVISIPVRHDVVDSAGYLAAFLDRGGLIAWGVVATDGPVPHTVERPWRLLSELWCELVKAGCDPVQLRTRSMVTPACGLGLHSPQIADTVFALVRQVQNRIADQAVATRITFGA